MKKFLSLVAVSSLLCSNFAMADNIGSADGEKSGLFIGLHGGVTLFNLSANDKNGNKNNNYKGEFGVEPMEISFDIGAKLGYQHFFMPLIGVRGYLSYDFYGKRPFVETYLGSGKITGFHNIVLNIDALINFINNDNFTLGVYAGFGLGYGITNIIATSNILTMINNMNYNGFNIPINVGIATTFATHHKVELGAKIQTLAAGYTLKKNAVLLPDVNVGGVFINPYVINIGYSYIF